MTEEEKIFAGKMFDPRSEELRQIKHKAHETCRRYNTLDEYDPERQQLIRSFIGGIGKTFYFQGPIQINYGSHTFIGENFFANFGLTIMDDARVYLGNNVCFGPNVSLMATTHPLIAQERMGMDAEGRTTMAEYADEIHIGNNVWIACNAVVLGGVHRRTHWQQCGHRSRQRGHQGYSRWVPGLRQSLQAGASHHRGRLQKGSDPPGGPQAL